MMQTIHNNKGGAHLASALLEGTVFAGFSFSTQFTLRFSRSAPSTYAGHDLPAEVEIVFHATWWFGEADEWREHVERFAPPGAVEPEEPVQARELAHLRWTEGTTVESVEISNGALSIRFANGRALTVSSENDDGDTAWILGVAGAPEPSASWSVASAGGDLFVRGPHLVR